MRLSSTVIIASVVIAASGLIYFVSKDRSNDTAQEQAAEETRPDLLPFTPERLQAALTLPGEPAAPQDPVSMNLRLHEIAEMGNAMAQMALGLTYSTGTSEVAQNHEEAAKWWTKSAEQGRVDSQLFLAKAYQDGRGVPKDDVQAAKWRLAAAEQGNAEAQLMIGMAYNLGEGVPQNYAEAEKWYGLSAAQGNTQAQTNLAMLKQVQEAPLRIMEKSLEERSNTSAGE